MSILRAISSKRHPVRRGTNAWSKFGDYQIKDNENNNINIDLIY